MATCNDTFETADTLLRRNWFLDRNDFLEYMWELPEDVYLQLVEHKDRYVDWIRELLTMDPLPSGPLKIVDIPDDTWERMHDDRVLEFERWKRSHRQSFVPPPRPHDQVDEEMQSLLKCIETKRELLQELIRLEKRSKRYLPPSQRTNLDEDLMVRETRNKIQYMENRFTTLSEKVEALNKTWTELQWLDAVHRDVAKRQRSIDLHVDVVKNSV